MLTVAIQAPSGSFGIIFKVTVTRYTASKYRVSQKRVRNGKKGCVTVKLIEQKALFDQF